MQPKYQTKLYERIFTEVAKIAIVDCHEHLQRDSELPTGDDIHIGRFFAHYANSDLISAGMPAEAMDRVVTDNTLSPLERWKLLEPWYQKAWNTGYCEALRIALQDIYGIEDFSSDTVELLTERMRQRIKLGFTREIFDKAGIDFAMNHLFGPKKIYNHDFDQELFSCDMVDCFAWFPNPQLIEEADRPINSLADYLAVIDDYFERFAPYASAFKVNHAYARSLKWDSVAECAAEKIFQQFLTSSTVPGHELEHQFGNYIMHYLCKKCGEYKLRMKFHTGLHAGNGNDITNSRAALLINLFLQYPETNFDIYHISYPYQEELTCIAKNFPNVTVDFCWMWVINPAAARRALSEMLDTIPVNKIHGFGGDYIFVEGSYGHAVMARRNIVRVLCEKIEEGRFSENYAVTVAKMILRENPLENFNLNKKRKSAVDKF